MGKLLNLAGQTQLDGGNFSRLIITDYSQSEPNSNVVKADVVAKQTECAVRIDQNSYGKLELLI